MLALAKEMVRMLKKARQLNALAGCCWTPGILNLFVLREH